MQGLAASAFARGVAVEVCVGTEVAVAVGGTGVLVEDGMGVAEGVLTGRGAPQADKIKARTIANLASEIFFISRSLLATLAAARMNLKNRVIYLRADRNPDPVPCSLYDYKGEVSVSRSAS